MPEYSNQGDSLRANRIAVEARSISPVTVKKMSGGHKGQFATLRNNAYCVIEIPLKWILEKKSNDKTT